MPFTLTVIDPYANEVPFDAISTWNDVYFIIRENINVVIHAVITPKSLIASLYKNPYPLPNNLSLDEIRDCPSLTQIRTNYQDKTDPNSLKFELKLTHEAFESYKFFVGYT